jgi:hypothetical protein
MEYVAVPSFLRLRARELDHLGPFLRFLDDEFAEIGLDLVRALTAPAPAPPAGAFLV